MARAVRFEDLAAAKPDLLDDRQAHARLVNFANKLAVKRGLVHVPVGVALKRVVSLAAQQTPFRAQGTRGTCYAFAACAALEASYKRKHGLNLDLSEQYAFHLNMSCELYPSYLTTATPHENNSSYWGFRGSSDIVDKLKRAALPDESSARYLSGTEMSALKASTPASGKLDDSSSQDQLDAFEYLEANVPLAARHGARYRVARVAAVPPNPRIDQLETILSAGHEVVADIPGHCFLLIGYDQRRRVFKVKNSWGEGRFIDYSYDSPILGGRYVLDVEEPDAFPQRDAFWLGRWHVDHDGHHGELVIRRTTDYRGTQGDPTKLGNYQRNGQSYDVNGRTLQDGQALHFWIADQSGRIQPGAAVGQEFWAYVFTRDPANAAGTTRWGGSEYGVSLGRSEISGKPSQGFGADAWIGRWSMNHDGWRGLLQIRSAKTFAASYRGEDGRDLRVSGAPDASQPHILRISIPFSSKHPQQFQLFGHTWENNRFSGITEWQGGAFGVQGVKELPGRGPLRP